MADILTHHLDLEFFLVALVLPFKTLCGVQFQAINLRKMNIVGKRLKARLEAAVIMFEGIWIQAGELGQSFHTSVKEI